MEPPVRAVNPDRFAALPAELAALCLGNLDNRSILRTQRVSKGWQRLANSEVVWEIVCKRAFGDRAQGLKGNNTWQATYRFTVIREAILAGPSLCKSISSTESICSYCDYEITVTVTKKGQASIVSTAQKAIKTKVPQTFDLQLSPAILNDLSDYDRSYITRHSQYIAFVFYTRNAHDGHFQFVRVWDMTQGKLCFQTSGPYFFRSFHLYKQFAIKSYYHTVEVWNMHDGNHIATLEKEDIQGGLLHAEQFLILRSKKSEIRVFDIDKNTYVKTLADSVVYYRAFILENTLILSKFGVPNAAMECWDINQWEMRQSSQVPSLSSGISPPVIQAEENVILYGQYNNFYALDREANKLIPVSQGQYPLEILMNVQESGPICYLRNHHGLIFVGMTKGHIYVYDQIAGKQVHHLILPKHDQEYIMYGMHAQNNTIIVSTNHGLFEWSFALPPKPGAPKEGFIASLFERVFGARR